MKDRAQHLIAAAAAVLCEPGRHNGLARLAVLEAEQPLAALAALAHTMRRRSRARVVCIGGSAGKTSTKDTLRALLAPHLPLVASPASYNNELGVPLTLALLEPDTAVCVCELGTGAPGELAALCRIAAPEVGVITALGPEHLQFFGSIECGSGCAERNLHVRRRQVKLVVLRLDQDPRKNLHRRSRRNSAPDDPETLHELVLGARNPHACAYHDVSRRRRGSGHDRRPPTRRADRPPRRRRPARAVPARRPRRMADRSRPGRRRPAAHVAARSCADRTRGSTRSPASACAPPR